MVTLSGAATFGLAFSMAAAAAVAEIVLAFCATMSSMSNAFQAENDHERNDNNDTERCLLVVAVDRLIDCTLMHAGFCIATPVDRHTCRTAVQNRHMQNRLAYRQHGAAGPTL